MFAQKRVDVIFEAAEPIAHHAESLGNHAIVQMRKIRRHGGGFCKVPEITGDTMRNRMRHWISIATMRAADMLGPNLTEGALRLLFAGGMVTGRGDAGVVSLDRYRELCELVPSLSIFGGCADNRVVPGKLWVEPATLICAETERYLAPWMSEWLAERQIAIEPSRPHIEIAQRVRMDPQLNPSMRALMLPDAQVSANAQLGASEAAHGADDAAAAKKEKSSMLPRTFERVVQGSLFSWRCTVTCHSALEQDTFYATLAELMANGPRVGGKQGTGHGLLRTVAARGVELERSAERLDGIDLAHPEQRIGELFRRHVAERAPRIREFFKVVNA